MDVDDVVNSMTLEEKISYVAGTNFMHTREIPRLGVPSLCMADGPHGLRKQVGEQDNGVSQSEPATSFPTAATVASSWNPSNAFRIGEAIAEECVAYDVHMLLGPGINIKRNPLCGRNFEYYSEDPLLAGEMGAAEVQGIQSKGVGSCVKHFALNNTENYRFMGNSIAESRTMNEIYLKPFERVVKQGRPAAIMSAYNQVNGAYCSQNRWLLDDVLRDQWGHAGLVMTDWGGMHDRVAALEAGLDLEMPGDTAICRKWIADGLAEGRLSMEDLDAAVRNILVMVNGLVRENGTDEETYGIFDRKAHDELAAEVAVDSAVLLKNDGALPLSGQGRYVVVGDLFEKMRYQGAGSSMINPDSITTPKDAFDARGVNYSYARGYVESTYDVQADLVGEAHALAENADCDAILAFVGLTDYAESEGCDRPSLALPENQIALIEALAKLDKPLVVVLFGGSAIDVPFADDVDAILYMGLPGQSGGNACARLLFGDACPSGHLAETWPYRYEDVPGHETFGKRAFETYREGLMVGYRGYCSHSQAVRYPFGFGLSYTSFDWRDMEVAVDEGSGAALVSCTVENTGSCAGATTVQLYVAAPETLVEKPACELRAFAKVPLQPGQVERVTLRVSLDDLRFYDPDEQQWILEAGEYEFRLCSDAQTIVLGATVELDGAHIAKRVPASFENLSDAEFAALCGCDAPLSGHGERVTVESKVTELNRTFFGRILFNTIVGLASKQEKSAQDMPEGAQRDNYMKGAVFLRRVLESNSLVSMSMCAGDAFPYNYAQGAAHLANGNPFKAAKSFLSRIRVDVPRDGAGTSR